MGELTIICGSMFSGKSTELLNLYKKKKIQNKKCILICSKLVGHVYTHNNTIENTDYSVFQLSELQNIDISNSEIFIDEGHFFQDIMLVSDFLKNKNNVTISTLTTNYKYEPFEDIGRLMCYADNIIKFTSICEFCKLDNGKVNHRIADSDDLILVGKKDKYVPLCYKCFSEIKLNKI